MYNRILVAMETLPDATPLVTVAGRIARASGARVYGLAAQDWSQQVEVSDLTVEWVHETAPIAVAIHEAAQRHQVDLIIMGSDCRPGTSHEGHPATTESVVLATTLPVLLVRSPHVVRLPTSERPFHTLIPLDGSTVAESVLPVAAALTTALAGPVGGSIHLVQIVRGLPLRAHSPRATMLPPQEVVHLYLEEQAQRVRALVPATIQVVTRMHFASDVSEALLALLGMIPDSSGAPTEYWDLMAMGVLGPTGYEPHEGSSVVSQVLHATTLPFLVKCSRTMPEMPRVTLMALETPTD
jgi:nucleotide-binding universal stress UspA family protein